MECELRNAMEIVPHSKELGSWSVIIQVLYKSPILTAKTNRQYRKYLLTDMMGTKISAVTFDSHSSFFEHTLLPYRRYKISNAQISELYKHADKDNSIDMKGLIIHEFPAERQKNEKLMRIYILINQENIPIMLRIWCEKDIENEHAVHNLEKGPVYLVVTDIRVSTFHGLSLTSRYDSHLIQEPPMEGVVQLKEWYMDNKEEISEWKGSKIYQNLQRFFLPPPEEEIRNLPTVVRQIEKLKTTWVRAKIELVETATKPWYVVCEYCTKSLDKTPNTRTFCNSCSRWMITDIRTRLVARFRSDNETMLTTVNSPDTNSLINMTPEEVKQAYDKGIPLYQKMTQEIGNRTVVCFVKSYESDFKGEKKSNFPTLRLFLEEHVQQANESKRIKQADSIFMSSEYNQSSQASTCEGSSDPASEKQMFTPTFKTILPKTTADLNAQDDQSTHCRGVKRQIVFGTIDEPELPIEDPPQSTTSTSTDKGKDPETATKKLKSKAGN